MGFIFQKCVLLPGVEKIFELKPFQSTCNGGTYFIPKHMFMEREGGGWKGINGQIYSVTEGQIYSHRHRRKGKV